MWQGVPPWHTAEEMRQFSNAAHFIEGLLVAAAGTLALAQAFARLDSRRNRQAQPVLVLVAGVFLMLMAIGGVFLTHQQHGTGAAVARAVMIHQWLGALFLFAGLVSLRARLHPAGRWAPKVWPIALLLAGLLLTLYREPAGAYRGEHMPAHER